jgi:hypothetical protein
MNSIGIGAIAVLLAAVGLIVSVLKPGKNAQAVRAISIVAIFSGMFWLALTGAVWALMDFVLPNKKAILKSMEAAQKKQPSKK